MKRLTTEVFTILLEDNHKVVITQITEEDLGYSLFTLYSHYLSIDNEEEEEWFKKDDDYYLSVETDNCNNNEFMLRSEEEEIHGYKTEKDAIKVARRIGKTYKIKIELDGMTVERVKFPKSKVIASTITSKTNGN